VGVVNLAVLAFVLRTTTKKVINFLRKKCTPSTENPAGYAYGRLTCAGIKDKNVLTSSVQREKMCRPKYFI